MSATLHILTGQNFSNVSHVIYPTDSSPTGIASDKISSLNGNLVYASVPTGAINGFIKIVTNTGAATGQIYATFNPSLFSFGPNYALTGAQILLTGRNLSAVTGVYLTRIDGSTRIPSFSILSNSGISLNLPSGNVNGAFQVYSSGNKNDTLSYDFSPSCIVSGVIPQSGSQNTLIRIVGSGFEPTLLQPFGSDPNTYKVDFNGIPTGFVLTDFNNLTGLLPSGSVTGPISIYRPSGYGVHANVTALFTGRNAPIVQSAWPSWAYSGKSMNNVFAGSHFFSINKIILSGLTNGVSYTIPSNYLAQDLINSKTVVSGYLLTGILTGSYNVLVSSPFGTGSITGFLVKYPLNSAFYGGFASQSTTNSGDFENFGPQKANDGLFNNPSITGKSLALTNLTGISGWWEIDLKSQVEVIRATIYGSVDSSQSNLNFSLMDINRNSVFSTGISNLLGATATDFKINNITGKYLRIQITGATPYTGSLGLGEVQIY